MYMDMENETVISDRLDLGEISPDVFLHVSIPTLLSIAQTDGH